MGKGAICSHAIGDIVSRMTNRKARIPIIAIISLLVIAPALAQSDDTALRRALEAAEAGQVVAPMEHPAQPWVEYAALRGRLNTLSESEAWAFLDRHQDQPVAGTFRSNWLRAAYRRKLWAAFRAAWSPAITDTTLRCMALEARRQGGDTGPEWIKDAQALWRSSGQSLPDECDAPFATLTARGELTEALRWEWFELSAAAGEFRMMRSIARRLPPEQQALAEDYAAFVQSPHTRALNWPKTARSRKIAALGLTRLARRSPAQARAQLPPLTTTLELTEAETGPVLYQIALQHAASWLADAARDLDAVPDSAYDQVLHEWRVREALARQDWPGVRAAIAKMPPAQRTQSRWRWFAARAAELDGDAETARTLYREAATGADFHGFLAADRLDLPYALCPLEVSADPAKVQRVAQDPAIQRALALYRIGRTSWALHEWDAALVRFNDDERRIAVKLAQDSGWLDRAVFAMNRAPEDISYYTLRFPLHYSQIIQREARRNQLDPAWVAAEIRAESVFNPRARSPANARGLMQVLPDTARGVARRQGLPWNGAESLYDPETNITLGTAYLREKEAMYRAAYIAIAAYNAGPVATRRWQEQRPDLDPDMWIETIGYPETRGYVARVLAFSVIYDWRMSGEAVPVSARMLGQQTNIRKMFACPAGAASS